MPHRKLKKMVLLIFIMSVLVSQQQYFSLRIVGPQV